MNEKILPKSFEILEPFVEKWALSKQNERQKCRINSSKGELRVFYEAMLPRMEDVLLHVDKFPLGEMPNDVYRLFCLALSIAEVAPHIELYRGNPEVPYSFDESRFIAEHGDLDT